jgi:photosystem II stability/assembly factor-like uncharacterized protein
MKNLKLLHFIFLFFTCANAQWIIQQAPTSGGIKDIYFADTSNGWITALDDGIFHTSNGGYSWNQQYSSYAVNISGLSDSELWVIGKKDTLLHTTNGGINWEKISLKIFLDLDSVASLTGIHFYNSSIGWVYAFGWKLGTEAACLIKTTDSGVSWHVKINPITSVRALIQFLDTSYGFIAGTDPVPLCKTTDGGESWDTLAYLGFWGGLMDMQFINQNTGWATADGPVLTTTVWKTTDGGLNWENNLLFQCSDLSTYICFTDTLKGWVVQWTCISAATEIYHTTNGGLSWELQYTYSPFSPQKIYFIDSSHGWVIARYTGTILYTSTGGIIPVELTSFTAEFTYNKVILNWTTATETNNSGFVIQRKKSEDRSQESEWEKIGFVQGFGTTTEPKSYSFIDEDVITGNYKYRLKQIDYDGSFKYSNIVEAVVGTPTEYLLEQNYPNPFNSSTSIKFYLSEKSNITLTIYDILGKEIKVLVSGTIEEGNYEVKFDADNYPSGIYACRLDAGNINKPKSITIKMMLIK